MQEKATKKNVYSIIKSIKQRAIERDAKVITNMYNLFKEEEQMDYVTCLQGNNCIVFWEKDSWDVCRVFFAASDLSELSIMLKEVPSGAIMDYNSDKNNQIQAYYEQAGFVHIASYLREGLLVRGISYEDIATYSCVLDDFYDESIVEYAQLSDVDELMGIIEDVFDKETDHLPTREKLVEWIKKKWVLIYREAGKIYTIHIYEILGKKMYSALSYNSVTADKLYTLEKKGFLDATQNHDIHYFYAWFKSDNEKALQRIRLKEDGLMNYIYRKQ